MRLLLWGELFGEHFLVEPCSCLIEKCAGWVAGSVSQSQLPKLLANCLDINANSFLGLLKDVTSPQSSQLCS
jgi:hypothetical protein